MCNSSKTATSSRNSLAALFIGENALQGGKARSSNLSSLSSLSHVALSLSLSSFYCRPTRLPLAHLSRLHTAVALAIKFHLSYRIAFSIRITPACIFSDFLFTFVSDSSPAFRFYLSGSFSLLFASSIRLICFTPI